MQATKKAQICFWIKAELDKQRHATATDECSCYARTLRYKSCHIFHVGILTISGRGDHDGSTSRMGML